MVYLSVNCLLGNSFYCWPHVNNCLGSEGLKPETFESRQCLQHSGEAPKVRRGWTIIQPEANAEGLEQTEQAELLMSVDREKIEGVEDMEETHDAK